jgi:hypothetical protein
MVTWTKFLTIFVISAIFALGLIQLGLNLESLNDSPTTILINPFMSSFNNTLGTQLGSFQGNSSQQYNVTSSESSGSSNTFYFVLQSIFNSLTRMIGFENLFGIPTIITKSLFGLIILVGIFAWYKMLKQGEG